MTTKLSSPSSLHQNYKEKGLKEGTYLQAPALGRAWVSLQCFGALTIEALTMEFMGLLQSCYRGIALAPTASELCSCSNSSRAPATE